MRNLLLFAVLFYGISFNSNSQVIDYKMINYIDSGNNIAFMDKISVGEVKSDENKSIDPEKSAYGKCTLIKNHSRERKITSKGNTYRIVTSENDENLVVKEKGGTMHLHYENDQEMINYKRKKNGKYKYTYRLIDDCTRLKVKRNFKGITSASKNAKFDLNTARQNIKAIVEKGTSSCTVN